MSETDPLPSKTVDYAKLRKRFGLGFLISTSLFVVFTLCGLTLASLGLTAAAPPTRRPEGTPLPEQTHFPETAIPITPGDTLPTHTPRPPPAGQGVSLDTLTLAAAVVGIGGTCLTSATTLGGFAITTVLSLRQERRYARVSDLERQLQEVALEKQKLELERLRKEQQNRGTEKDS